MNISITITRDDELKAVPTGSVCVCGCPPDMHLYDIYLEFIVGRPSTIHSDVILHGCKGCNRCMSYQPKYGV